MRKWGIIGILLLCLVLVGPIACNPFGDDGEKTIQEYKDLLGNAKTIFVSGPCGVFENPLFRKGTEEIFHFISQSLTTFSGLVSNSYSAFSLSSTKYFLHCYKYCSRFSISIPTYSFW